MQPVRWGILGAAKIAREWVCPGIHASGSGIVAAVASRTAEKAAAVAENYPGARVFGAYEALLADPGIEAVYIPLPNSEHVAWTARALDAGKHVLCEKPIALKAEEIDGLIALRDRTGLLAAEAFMVLHHPQWQRVRELIAEGAIGEIRQVQGAFSFFNDDPGNIRNLAGLGGGALRDIGLYPCVVTRFVTGAEPEAVSATAEWDRGIDATARASARFPGFVLDFYVSMRMAPFQVMHFHGTRACLTVEAPFNAGSYGDTVIALREAGGTVRRERFPRADQYRAQAEALHASIRTGAPFPCPLEFSRANQRMIDMIYAAAA
ncbi:MAG TPA: Gfo/Idh/MocA family oxidoreductase [Paracoccaceae bacterium]|nr:Gfo/Idh/MocA family oxidoreductase [Paracoccaceae bacterium]